MLTGPPHLCCDLRNIYAQSLNDHTMPGYTNYRVWLTNPILRSQHQSEGLCRPVTSIAQQQLMYVIAVLIMLVKLDLGNYHVVLILCKQGACR